MTASVCLVKKGRSTVSANSLLIVNAVEQSGGPSYLSNKRLIKSEKDCGEDSSIPTPPKAPIGSSFHSQPPSVQLGNWIGDGVRSGEEKAPREAGKCVTRQQKWEVRPCKAPRKPNNTSSQVGRGTRPALSPGRHRISELTKPSDSFIPPENIFLFLYSVAEDRGTQARCAPSCVIHRQSHNGFPCCCHCILFCLGNIHL
ncbi:hypothetical protein F7725_018300 [Dissostichus mawsoni]|uniref:Uncharacterized protein n=1 Tax=Dissostichus mawsoni TaxID=36200 RepID=A0A7J5XRY2_DISMA|nr:hypothetical protein F7725_018300 [Dissostichus mawsoni]